MSKTSAGHKPLCDPILDCQPLDAEPSPLGRIIVNGMAHPFYLPGDLFMAMRLAGTEVRCKIIDCLPFAQQQGRYDRWRQTALGRQIWPLPRPPNPRGHPEGPMYWLHPDDPLRELNREHFIRGAIAVIQGLAPRYRRIAEWRVADGLSIHRNTYRNYLKDYHLHHQDLLRLAFGG